MKEYHSPDVQYNPLRAIITRTSDLARVTFDIIPVSGWQDETKEGLAAWDESQNYAWSVAESVVDCLELGGVTIKDGKEAIWAVVREKWYPDDDVVELAEAKREWKGARDEHERS